MIELEVFQNELAVEFHDIETDLWLIKGTPCYTEAAEQAKENIFQRAVKKIKELFQKVKDKITEFIQDREFKKLEKQLQENPELAKKTVKMPDYDKLHKLNKDTANKMTDKNCDPEKEMAKYKKQRNILLGAGAAVTISLGVALMKIKKLKGQCDESIKSLSKAVDELEIANREYDRLERVSEGNKKGFNQLLELEAEKNKNLAEKNKKLTEMVSDRDKIIDGLYNTTIDTNKRYKKIRDEVLKLKRTISKKTETVANISKEDANDYVNALKKIWYLMRESESITIEDRDKHITTSYMNSRASYT